MWSCWKQEPSSATGTQHPQVSSLSLLDARVETPILNGTREIKPHCLQDQTHHGHAVGSPSMLAEEEVGQEREVMALGRTLSLSQQPTRGQAPGTQQAQRTDGLTAASRRSTAACIWHTCFGLCLLTLQMAGRGVGSFFFSQFLVQEEPNTVVSHKERLTQNPAMSLRTELSPACLGGQGPLRGGR